MTSYLKYFVLLFCSSLIEGSFRCDYKYSAVANGWFKYFVVPATWFDARLRCALEGAVLASPTTPAIKAEMTRVMKNYSNKIISETEIFTGIHATFSQGDFYTVGGVPLSKIPLKWAANEPDNFKNNERCIALNGYGNIADKPCEVTLPYICYRSNEVDKEVNACGTIDPEYNLDQRTNKCYKFHTVPRTFTRANFACSAEGGHLAIINSETESTVLKELFAKYPEDGLLGIVWRHLAFIGFSDWNERGEWRTVHGQTLPEAGFSRFSPGEPNNATEVGEYCGSILRDGLLNDVPCDLKPCAFICEKDPKYPPVCRAIPEPESVYFERA